VHAGGLRTLDATRRKLDALRRHCASAGRPYEAILKSHIGLPVVVAESSAALEAKQKARFGALPADLATLHRTSVSRSQPNS